MTDPHTSIVLCADVDDVNERAAELFAQRVRSGVERHGRFTMALSGCPGLMRFCERLGGEPCRSSIPWSKIHLFWTHSGCSQDDDRDDAGEMMGDLLLSRVQIPLRNIYPPPVAYSDCHRAATVYEQTLRAFFGLGTMQLPRFDFISLAMGSDGHLASLFPGTSAASETARLVVANYVSNLDQHHITLTAPVISNAANIVVLVAGEDRASSLRDTLTGAEQPDRLPLQLIRPVTGKLFYFIDPAAARQLPSPDAD